MGCSSLRGSGSDDVRADGAIVPAKYADVELWTVPALRTLFIVCRPRCGWPITRRLLQSVFAKGSLEVFADIAKNKIPMLTSASRPTEVLLNTEWALQKRPTVHLVHG
ncbi:MAG: hypothetical protein ACNYPE_06865 [Candidatus Azotimanducaceae bacterium WSBS_2022_MAG_OTU7]